MKMNITVHYNITDDSICLQDAWRERFMQKQAESDDDHTKK